MFVILLKKLEFVPDENYMVIFDIQTKITYSCTLKPARSGTTRSTQKVILVTKYRN